MANLGNGTPKNPAVHLHVLSLVVAICAGLVSVVGGVYSLRANFFTPKTGTLQGIVRDESIAKPLWLASVEVSNADGAIIAVIDTSESGRYSLSSLREGDYTIKVSAPFHEAQSKNIRIYQNATSSVNFDLKPEEQKKEFSSVSEQAQLPPPPVPSAYPPPRPADYETQQMVMPTTGDAAPYSRRGRYRHARRTSDVSGTTQSASPLQDVLAQLVQSWTDKKSEDTTSN